MQFEWQRFGGYEVSTKGDRRFSAFNAIMPDGRSLECHFQCDVKNYQPGGRDWRMGKGKPPLDTSIDLWDEYLELWRTWAQDHDDYMWDLRQKVMDAGFILSDRFATTPINQAHALAVLLNERESLMAGRG